MRSLPLSHTRQYSILFITQLSSVHNTQIYNFGLSRNTIQSYYTENDPLLISTQKYHSPYSTTIICLKISYQGKLHVWDWKSTKSYRKFQAHDGGPCMGAAWHPLQPSWIATCGWDGLIKLWD